MRPKKTILCVDDNEQVLSVRTFLLETRGYHVVGARCAREALEILRDAIPGAIDLLLSDLLMPGMDGDDLVRRAKELHPGLPAMIVSGTVAALDRALHADVFLPKGASSPAELLERVRVLVARKRGPKRGVPGFTPVQPTGRVPSQQAPTIGMEEVRTVAVGGTPAVPPISMQGPSIMMPQAAVMGTQGAPGVAVRERMEISKAS